MKKEKQNLTPVVNTLEKTAVHALNIYGDSDPVAYENPDDEVCLLDKKMEREIFKVLDRVVKMHRLSYYECNFDVVSTKMLKE